MRLFILRVYCVCLLYVCIVYRWQKVLEEFAAKGVGPGAGLKKVEPAKKT